MGQSKDSQGVGIRRSGWPHGKEKLVPDLGTDRRVPKQAPVKKEKREEKKYKKV